MAIGLNSTAQGALRRMIEEAFPDSKVSDADVEGAAAALHLHGDLLQADGELPGSLEALREGLKPLDAELRALAGKGVEDGGEHTLLRAPGDSYRYYWVEATHARVWPDGFKAFTGKLAMVRASLPQTNPETVRTAVGVMKPADHLIATVAEANDKYASALGYSLKRIDMITPAREGLRFGAISVLLGYKDADGAPSCYILEAGKATGEPKVLYLSATMDKGIDAYAGYQPSAFACPDNAYTGAMSVEGDSPDELTITVRKIIDGTSQSPYMELSAVFQEDTDHIRNIWPGFLILRAACIVEVRKLRGTIPEGCNDEVSA